MAVLRFPFQSLYTKDNKLAGGEQFNIVNFIGHLKQADILSQLTITQLEIIAEICHEEIFRTNDVIFSEGAESNELYIIIQGGVDIIINPSLDSIDPKISKQRVLITKLGRGQSFGEIALVDQGFRSATAKVSQNNTRLLVIPRQKLVQLCEEYPQLGFRLMKNLATELANKLRGTVIKHEKDNQTHPII